MTTRLTLPLWADLHAHFRQGALMPHLAADHLAMGCYAVLAMPNTRPPVSKVLGENTDKEWSVEGYSQMMRDAFGGKAIIIAPLYITRAATAQMIEQGAKAGVLKAAKYYPPHGTTNSDHGLPMADLIGSETLKVMEECGTVLCIHGEEHALGAGDYFDKHRNAETLFYENTLPRIVDAHPRLKIVAEHITTKAAADFVLAAGDNVAGSITPQHLLFTVGDLLQGWFAHLRCMPLVKFEEDRAALRDAATKNNTRFFAGTDSAPHPRLSKTTDCGCAAGCYTGGIAPQLYAQGFEAAGIDLSTLEGAASFQRFLCDIGPAFYGLPKPEGTFSLIREPSPVVALEVEGVGQIVPLPLGMAQGYPQITETMLPWRIEVEKR